MEAAFATALPAVQGSVQSFQIAARVARRPAGIHARSSFEGQKGFSSSFGGRKIFMQSTQRSFAATQTRMSLLEQQEEAEKAARVKSAGFSYDDFAKLLDETGYEFKTGQIVSGQIVSLEKNGCFVDIGSKAAAWLPLTETSIRKITKPEEAVTEGETREFFILKEENEDGQLTLSVRRLEYQAAWERCRALQAEDQTVEAEIIQVNRGGAMVNVEGLRGFVPGSHLGMLATMENIGQRIQLKFLQVDEEQNRLVLSNRRAMLETQVKQIDVGQVAIGLVKSIKPYGAFVDIGGINGLLHISQISSDHIDNVAAVLSPDEKIKCMVLHADMDRGRISLSTKHLEPEPGDFIKNRSLVWDKAEEMAERYRLAQEQRAEAKAEVDQLLGEATDAPAIPEQPL